MKIDVFLGLDFWIGNNNVRFVLVFGQYESDDNVSCCCRHFFFTAMLFVYGRIISQRLVNTVTSDKFFYRLVGRIIKYQMVICYFLYIAGSYSRIFNHISVILALTWQFSGIWAFLWPVLFELLFRELTDLSFDAAIFKQMDHISIFQVLCGSFLHWRRRCTSINLGSMLGHTWYSL